MGQLRPDRGWDEGRWLTVDDHRQATSRVTTSRNTEELHVTDDNTTPIGQQPDGFMVNVPAYDVQTSNMQPDGSYVVRLHVQIPPGVLKRQSSILTSSGTPGNALQGALMALPEVALHLSTDKLTDAFIQQTTQNLLLSRLSANPDAPE
jgi:hypothetical protein